MCGSMVDIQSMAAEIRREKKERKKKKEITGWKYNGLPYYIGRPQKVKKKDKWGSIWWRCKTNKWCIPWNI